jgi:C-terminal processing protease CtpA/Prc
MKRTIILLLLVSLFCCYSCNNNSQAKLAPEEKKPLIALGQLWGFLKYHHPAVAEGKYDWDMELIKLVPAIREAKNESQWKEILDNWIDSLPPVAESANKELPDMDAKTKPDYGELFNPEYFSLNAIEKIKFILDNAVITSNHYVTIMNRNDEHPGLINITNEPAYEEILYPNLSYRLLALFRYWNIVNYFFPYRDLCDEKWSDVLDEMLSDFVYAENQEQYIFTCIKLIVKIDDSHGFFHTNNNAFRLLDMGLLKPPFGTRFIEDKLVVTTFTGEDAYVKDKIKIGDVITAKDGEAVEDIVKRLLPYTPASNYVVKLRDIPDRILRGNSGNVVLTLLRDGKSIDIEVPCYDAKQLKVPNYANPHPEQEGYQILDNNIGYVLPSNCKAEDRENGIKKVLDGTKGVIIDLRCYPSDYMSIPFLVQLNITNMKASLVSYANISYPGYFSFANGEPGVEAKQTGWYKNKIVVLVNEETQSQAEDNVLRFQLLQNTVVIGSTTAGADGAIVGGVIDGQFVGFNLPGGIVTTMTGLGVYYPDGSDLQRVGVKIDEIVKPTISGIKAGRDEVLERAIEIIEADRSKIE